MADRRLTVAAALAAAAVLAAGCGSTPPQAPGPQAHQLNQALSTFSTACGHAAEVQEFVNSPRLMDGLNRLAASKVADVARIYHQNPHWVFQGKTVGQLVQMSVSYMTECGLHRAAARLRAATSG